MLNRIPITAVFGCLILLAGPRVRADARVGDAASKPDSARFDENYPDMKEWATTGVRGGVPARDQGKIAATPKSGDDIQAAIDAAAKSGGGVVLLASGTYTLDKTLELRSNVQLRGKDKQSVILDCTITSADPGRKATAILLRDTKHAGLEDLTLQNHAVAAAGIDAYREQLAGPRDNLRGISSLYVTGVTLQRAEDCWIDNCSILHSGTHPINAQGSYLTIRDSLIDGAFNKGDGADPAGSGNLYFISSYGLMYNCTVRNLRHALVMRDALAGEPCKYNVILDCNFEGDVDFHANRKDEGHNLFEGTLVHAPQYHGWCAWSYWKRADIGPDNLVYRCIGWGGPAGKGAPGAMDKFSSTDPDKVYTYTGVRDPNILPALDKPAPHAATLYAVTGARPSRPEAYGAWPKTPAEALRLLDQRMMLAQ